MNESPLEPLILFIKRFLVLPNEVDYFIVACWIMHTYFTDVLVTTPRLAFISPEYGCGKSRALEVIESLSFRAEKLDYCTRPYLMRKVDEVRKETNKSPTLLIDEADTIYKNHNSEESHALTAFLNTGYRLGGSYGIVEGEGKNRKATKFSTFAPIAFAGKGEIIPEAVTTRSIIFRLQKRLPGQKIEDFLTSSVRFQAQELREWLSEWTNSNSQNLEVEGIEIPLRDRDREVWSPIFGVAVLAGREEEFFQAVKVHQNAKVTNEIPRERLLIEDSLKVYEQLKESEKLKTQELVKGLKELPDTDYAGLSYGRGLSDRLLAKWLRPYEITPKQIRFGDSTAKGYYRSEFESAFRRYSHTPAEVETEETKETDSPGLW